MGRVSWRKLFRCTKREGLSLIAFLLSPILFGQSQTLNQFLKSSLDEPYFKSFDLQSAYLQKTRNFSLPWLNEMQFRYQDNELDNLEQRYGLRLEPGNPWQIGNNRRYFQGINTLKNIEQKLALKNLLLTRYEMVVEYWMAVEQAEIIQLQKEKREQIGYAIEQKTSSSGFDAEQYLNSQIDIVNKTADWQQALLERDAALARIMNESETSSFNLEMADLVSIDAINQLVDSETETRSKTELDFFKQRIAVSEEKQKLEKSNIDLGFLQAMYTDRENKSRSPFGIAVGISIPLNANRDDIAREKLTQLERQSDLEKFQSEEKRRAANTIAILQLHFNHYQKLDSIITRFQSRNINTITGVANNFDPVAELKYQEKLIQFEVLKIKIKRQILLNYIIWLSNTDKLHQRPLVNYLSQDFAHLED